MHVIKLCRAALESMESAVVPFSSLVCVLWGLNFDMEMSAEAPLPSGVSFSPSDSVQGD